VLVWCVTQLEISRSPFSGRKVTLSWINWVQSEASLLLPLFVSKVSNFSYEIIETDSQKDDGIKSELFLPTAQISDAAIYKCFAENEHGKDEKSIKLEVVEVPDAPKNVRAKEVWSRTVSVVWTEAFTGNLPISKYTVQYWRFQSAPHRLHELTIPGSQTSIFIKDLSPGQAYELSVVGKRMVTV